MYSECYQSNSKSYVATFYWVTEIFENAQIQYQPILHHNCRHGSETSIQHHGWPQVVGMSFLLSMHQSSFYECTSVWVKELCLDYDSVMSLSDSSSFNDNHAPCMSSSLTQVHLKKRHDGCQNSGGKYMKLRLCFLFDRNGKDWRWIATVKADAIDL